MNRRTLLASCSIGIAGLSGCIFGDRVSNGKIKMNATEADCSNETVDMNFDERNTTNAVDNKLDEIIKSDEYVERPEYSSETLEIYRTLRDVDPDSEYSPTMIHRGSCYRVSIMKLSDD